jgi:hypothetical protein
MKLKLIKWLIGWLLENHYYLVLEMALPPKTHVHRNPVKKLKQDPLIQRDEAE